MAVSAQTKQERPIIEAPARWRVLIPVSLGTLLSLFGDTALYTVLPTHFETAGVLLASIGILLSANRWVRLLANNAAGWACDHWPRRWLFVPALFLGAASTAVYVLTHGFWPLLIGRLMWGIAWAGIWVAGNTIILDVTNAADRGRWVGLYHMSFFIGAGVGAPLGGIFTDWLGYRPALAVAAGCALFGAFVALFLLPETRDTRPTAVPTAPQATVTKSASANTTPWGELVSATTLLWLNRLAVAGIMLSTLGFFLARQWGEVVQLGGRDVGVATLTGLALGLSTVLSMASAPLAGRISDGLRSRWTVVIASLLVGVVGFGLLALGHTWTILLGVPLISLGSGGNQSLAAALVGDLAGQRRRGRVLGIFYTAGDLGSAIGPPLAYGLIAAGSTPSAPYWLAAGLSAVMVLVALFWSLRASGF